MKTVEEIYREMLDCFAGKTGLDMRDDCDLAVRLYAAAAQIHALYLQGEWVVRQSFPQTAQAERLDYHAQLRGLSRKNAVRAEGALRFLAAYVGETDRVIPAGTVAMTQGLVRFETVEAGVLPAGAEFVDLPARAVEPGAEGNVPPEAICALAAVPTGIGGCYNPLSFAGGVDAEEDESLRQRVMESYRRLPNGANAAFYEQGALSFDQVSAAVVIPRGRGVGTVDVVVATHEGVPDGALMEQIREYFQEKREIAVDVAVLAPQTKAVDVRLKVAVKQGFEFQKVRQAVEKALAAWFCGERLGQPILLAQLGRLVFDCPGVENYTVLSPAADLPGNVRTLPVLGSVTVEAMS